jgi:hypothetical protein
MFQLFHSYVAVRIFILQVFYLDDAYVFTYVASVCSKCFICFRLMSHSSVSCCKCFRGIFRKLWGMARALGEGAWRAEGWQMGRNARLGSRR